MPLVVVTGFPSSGKTRRCVALAEVQGEYGLERLEIRE